MAEKVHFCKVVLVVGLAGPLVSHTRSLDLAEGLRHSLRELSVEVVMALSHILRVKVLLCSLQAPTEVQEIAFHILRVQMAVLVKVVFRSLERTGFYHIQQAHLRLRTAQDGLPEDSH